MSVVMVGLSFWARTLSRSDDALLEVDRRHTLGREVGRGVICYWHEMYVVRQKGTSSEYLEGTKSF
jgi:hypothetical protein